MMQNTLSATSARESRYPQVTLDLARRLERAEGRANAAYVEARRLLQSNVQAEWMNVAGVYAMFDGVDSPLTQTFGLGVFDPIAAVELDLLEDFFRRRGSAVFHEVCSLVDVQVFDLLSSRGYSPIEASTVLVRPTLPLPGDASHDIAVRIVDESEVQLWSRIAGQGWSSESAELAAFVEEIGGVMSRARGVHCFLAELEGKPIAAGALNLPGDIAVLAGASTIPDARRRGAQQALLRARLKHAAEQNTGLAMVVTQPGSASQRNAERHGFRPAYTRAKWQLDLDAQKVFDAGSAR